MPINQTITAFPPAPNRATDTADQFSAKADAFATALVNNVTELNSYAGQANTTQTAINASESSAAASAQTAAASATVASGAANYRGEYAAGTTYTVGQSVSFNNAFYIAKVTTTGVLPTNTANWQLIPGGDVTLNGTQTLINKTLAAGTQFTGDALARLHAIALSI